MSRFDAVWLDAGGVLVLPDPTVLGPLLAYYGAAAGIERHRRAHYAAMAAKSAQGAEERDWRQYDEAYVRSLDVSEELVDEASRALGRVRIADLWRWPIPESVDALRALGSGGVPLAVVSNASGQVERSLLLSRVCQVGPGPGTPVRCVIDSHVVGVAKPDPAIFDFAAAHFVGVDRRRIAYVGDSVMMDVGGAVAADLHPILIDPYDDHADAMFERIHSLADLLA